MNRLHISLEGNIGVGKTTLLRAIEKETELQVFEENVASWTFLTRFYQDKKKYSYPLQKEILLDIKRHMPVNNVITERSARTSLEVFTRISVDQGHITEKQLERLKALELTIPRPTLYVYLKADIPTLMKRIALRAREGEASIDESYLLELEEKHESFISSLEEPVLVLDATESQEFLVSQSLHFFATHCQLNLVELAPAANVTFGPSNDTFA